MKKWMMFGLIALATGQAYAAGNTIKVGVLAEMSGTFADFGMQITNGAKAYMRQHGDTVAGKKIELVVRDTTGPAPDVAKRLAQELVVKDNVDFIVGFGLTPNAFAVAPIATEAKKPTIIMNAATSVITVKSPYIARVSFTLAQVTEPMAQWAYKSGLRKIYTVVADYGPGHDAEQTFKKAFSRLGGEVIGELRVPLKNPEFGPFVQRVKDSKPQAIFVFVPAGELAVGFMKAYNERGLAQAGIKLLSTGDVTDDGVIEALGDNALGVISTHQYSAAHPSPENKAFLAAYSQINPKQRPNFMAVGGYDGMAAVYEVVRQLKGNIDGDKAMQVLKGMKLNSPRGPIQIDAETRDIVQNVYVREVRKVDGKLYNVEFETFTAVRDPGK
ncbi:ABC transporter substrate-binding protein [Herminiimonas sp. CN]|uniref:ABC transporter substrate-binding protein n=1 Tax=Herminiimonas sp. CN TaxID=1349818 RepID=UPI0004733C89|nr:ABC transporter substrate-binding protein [Herminiimonas sp. CN]